jgi:hypothetical protein
MTEEERLTPESIRNLMESLAPCATLVLAGNEAGDTSIELKNALHAVREECRKRGVDPQAFVAPMEEAGKGLRGETRGYVAMLRSPSVMRSWRGSNTVKPIVATGDRFDVRTVLSIARTQKLFYILALSQERTRLLKCTQDSSAEIPLSGTPASLEEAMQTRQPDHVLDNRATGGPSIGAGAVMFGTSTDREDKDQYLLHFFASLDRGVNAVLKGSTDPLVCAGVEHELALYRRVNKYPFLCEPGVHGAPDGLEGGEMHRRALELLDGCAAGSGSKVPADFDKRVGTGRASAHIQEIVTAAWEGRVSHLYFQESASYMGTLDPVRMRVKHTLDPMDVPVDLIDSAAYQTIRHGGEAMILAGAAMPNGVPVCALFRYAVAPSAVPQDNVNTAP